MRHHVTTCHLQRVTTPGVNTRVISSPVLGCNRSASALRPQHPNSLCHKLCHSCHSCLPSFMESLSINLKSKFSSKWFFHTAPFLITSSFGNSFTQCRTASRLRSLARCILWDLTLEVHDPLQHVLSRNMKKHHETCPYPLLRLSDSQTLRLDSAVRNPLVFCRRYFDFWDPALFVFPCHRYNKSPSDSGHLFAAKLAANKRNSRTASTDATYKAQKLHIQKSK